MQSVWVQEVMECKQGGALGCLYCKMIFNKYKEGDSVKFRHGKDKQKHIVSYKHPCEVSQGTGLFTVHGKSAGWCAARFK